MSGVKISEFTETTDPSGFEAAGVQGGANRKLNIGPIAQQAEDAKTQAESAQAQAESAQAQAASAQGTAQSAQAAASYATNMASGAVAEAQAAMSMASEASADADAALALASTTQGGTAKINSYVFVDNGDGTSEILITPEGATAMPVGNGPAGLSFPAAFWDAVRKVLSLGDRSAPGMPARATINFPCDGSDIVGIQADSENGKTMLTFFIGDDGISEDKFRFVHRAPDGSFREILKMGIDTPEGNALPFAIFGGVMGFKAGDYFQGFKGNDSATQQQFWVLPTADGTPGQVIATDGDGNLFFVNMDQSSAELNRTIVTDPGDMRLFDWQNAGWNQIFHIVLSRNDNAHYYECFLHRTSLFSEAVIFPLVTKGTAPVFKVAREANPGATGIALVSFGAPGTWFLSARSLMKAAAPVDPNETITPTDVTACTVQAGSGGGATSGPLFTFTPQNSAPAGVTEGSVYFNNILKSWVGVDASGNEFEFGREEKQRCLNNTGATIGNGKAVYVSGFASGNITVGLARANSKSTCVLVGIATREIANGAIGEVCFRGFVRDVPTNGIGVAGELVYVSEATAGELTYIEPSYPNLSALVGRIGASSATVGSLIVFPDTDPGVSTTNVPGFVFREGTMPASMYSGGKGEFGNADGVQFGTSFYANAAWRPNKARFRQSQGVITANARVGLYDEAGTLLAQTGLVSGSGDTLVIGQFAAELTADLIPGTLYHAVICAKTNGNLVYGFSPGALNNNPRMGFKGQIVMNANADCPADISSIIGSASGDRAWIEFYR
jgi:hypothetical protein